MSSEERVYPVVLFGRPMTYLTFAIVLTSAILILAVLFGMGVKAFAAPKHYSGFYIPTNR
nr:hypothetical protein TetV2_00089 [Oceanusvirus sp.]